MSARATSFKKQVTDVEVAEWCDLYVGGMTCQQIAEGTVFSHSTVWRNIRKRVQMRHAGNRGSQPRYTVRLIGTVKADRAAGLTYAQIASKRGCSINWAWRMCEGIR